jgi:hypothetical protein
VELEWHCPIPPEIDHATMGITNAEAAKLLMQVAVKLIRREKLFARHFEQVQATAPENEPRYAARKLRQFGATEKFVRTGAAKKALTGEAAPMFVRTNGKLRRLMIGLRKMVKGVNVYRVAQVGRFAGVAVEKGGQRKQLTAEQSFAHNRQRARAVSAAERGGASRAAARAAAQAKFGKTVGRVGDKEMPITANLSGDESVVTPVVLEELNITMQKRGF